ncbi:hypothetical protein HOK51_06245 [Candidatus Woesearchaeota archaeon]|jgi:hypothetical protein|nr:hypothetical protein [Candidatus Woesearchaeota archaeon]MBT7368913.1 hypothetical protein [Candidatus Woesearchaeota archaeon]
MTNKTEEIMDGIHSILENYEQLKNQNNPNEYSISDSNSPEDNALRELLLDVHNDDKLAKFLKRRRVIGILYDPNPESDSNYYLGWESSKGKIKFTYAQPMYGIGRGGRSFPFKLFEGRFYADKIELIHQFPALTVEKLEDCIKDFIEKYAK